MKRTLSEQTMGEGAFLEWSGNAEAGSGRMDILESKPDELIRIKLVMKKPMAATNEVIFKFEPDLEGTKVTLEHEWTEFVC